MPGTPKLTERDPIRAEEILYRRVLKIANYINTSLFRPVQPRAFRPTDNDHNGISLSRALFVDAERVAAAGLSDSGYRVVRLRAADIYRLGLTIEPAPSRDGLPGHCVIPELNTNFRDSGSEEYKNFCTHLAFLIKLQDIII